MLKLSARLLASLLAVSAVTAFCFLVIPANATTAGFTYLIVVLAIAAAWGLAESVAASILAMLCFNFFFFPPVGTLTIADPQNWVALFSFLVTALVASHLSDRAKKRTLEAKHRQRETEQLYALSRAILLTGAAQPVGLQAAHQIAKIFESKAVVLYDAASGAFYRGGAQDLAGIEDKLKQSVLEAVELRDSAAEVVICPIALGGRPIGGLAFQGLSLSDGALRALLNLVAIALERVRMEEAASRAEASRQTEEFKSTLLDAITHELKTPLTSIKAASTAILGDESLPASTRRELAVIIDEETDRLSALVSEAARMSQIEAGKIQLQRESIDIDKLIDRALQPFATQVDGRAMTVEVADSIPPVFIDVDLISLAIRQLIDNCLKYSPPNSPIAIRAAENAERALIRVIDQGPGIRVSERERIFEKFYRRQSSRDGVPGSGLGLYIAREIVRAHAGDLWVEGEADAGSEFCLSIPLDRGADSQ